MADVKRYEQDYTDYGVVAGIFTADSERATRATRLLRAAKFFVNDWFAGCMETPSVATESWAIDGKKGREAIWNFVQTKNTAIPLRG